MYIPAKAADAKGGDNPEIRQLQALKLLIDSATEKSPQVREYILVRRGTNEKNDKKLQFHES
jgi:hypothetical protein